MTKFDRETFATTGFLKEGDVGPVLAVSLGRAEVSLGPAEVVMIVKTLDMMLTESSSKIIKIIMMSLITPGS